jgi:hypothetical protein
MSYLKYYLKKITTVTPASNVTLEAYEHVKGYSGGKLTLSFEEWKRRNDESELKRVQLEQENIDKEGFFMSIHSEPFFSGDDFNERKEKIEKIEGFHKWI